MTKKILSLIVGLILGLALFGCKQEEPQASNYDSRLVGMWVSIDNTDGSVTNNGSGYCVAIEYTSSQKSYQYVSLNSCVGYTSPWDGDESIFGGWDYDPSALQGIVIDSAVDGYITVASTSVPYTITNETLSSGESYEVLTLWPSDPSPDIYLKLKTY